MSASLGVIRQLFQHMEWADSTVWRAVVACPAAREDATIRNYLCHIHNVQQAFLKVWKSEQLAFRDASAFRDVEEIQTWAIPYFSEAREFLEATSDGSLSRRIRMPWLEQYEQQMGRQFDTPTMAETMFQVASHSTYHRGQVNARLRAVGGEPPLVDYIAWIWFGKPAADWGV